MRTILIYDEQAVPVKPEEVGIWTLEGDMQHPDGWLLCLSAEEQAQLLKLQEDLSKSWPSESNEHSTDAFEQAYNAIIEFLMPISETVGKIDPVLMTDISNEDLEGTVVVDFETFQSFYFYDEQGNRLTS